jgi:hypothetical protein
MSEHTKGPWIQRYFPTGRSAVTETWVMDAIPDNGGSVVANAICKMAGTNPQVEANAKLIAAAPELLSQLQDARKWIGETERAQCVANTYTQLLDNIDAAIAKAT